MLQIKGVPNMEEFNIIGLIVQVVIGLTALRILFSWLRIFNE